MSKQGQGRATELKLRGIQSALSISLKLAKAKNGARWNYWHADLHAGSGYNQMAGCIGSPIAFINAAAAAGRQRYTAVFCDRDFQRIAELQSRVLNEKRAECVNWDNRELLPVLAERITRAEPNPHFAFGSILVDPNGYFDEGTVPHVELAEFAARFSRMDLIFNLNIRAYQLRRPHVSQQRGRWAGKFCPSPSALPAIFNRRYWLISNVRSVGGDRFCLFIGRSMPTGEHKDLGIYHFDGPAGLAIRAQIEGAPNAQETAASVPSLPDLFGIPQTSHVSGDSGGSDET